MKPRFSEKEEELREVTEYVLRKDRAEDLNHFLNGLNELIGRYHRRYIPDTIDLYFDGRKVLVNYNYDNKQYEVAK